MPFFFRDHMLLLRQLLVALETCAIPALSIRWILMSNSHYLHRHESQQQALSGVMQLRRYDLICTD